MPIEYAEILINHGADVNAKTKGYDGGDEKTPLDFAHSCKRKIMNRNAINGHK